jgi:hypothetical protein
MMKICISVNYRVYGKRLMTGQFMPIVYGNKMFYLAMHNIPNLNTHCFYTCNVRARWFKNNTKILKMSFCII